MRTRPMSGRRAAKEAAAIVADLIQNYLDVGQPGEDCSSGTNDDWIEADADRLTNAFERILMEMERRGAR